MKNGNLAVYGYLKSTEKLDVSNFLFMAKMSGEKTKSLDVMVLESAFKTYKELVAQGVMEMTENELNLAIQKAITCVKDLQDDSIEGLKDLF